MSNDTYEMFDAADYVASADDAALMLQTALEDSAADPYALPTALGIIARSGTMDELAHHVEP
jgi:DNA-binding phage protein